jgi:hypothetical protein
LIYKLGTGIAKSFPFERVPVPIPPPVKQKEIITTKLVITMVIIAIVKIAVLLLWI